VKRLVAVVLGAVGLTAWLKRRRQPAVEPSPADDLRAKLAETKVEPEPAPEPEPEAAPEPPAEDVATRRADVHDRARQAMAELRDEPE
jgi:hypothetical protein